MRGSPRRGHVSKGSSARQFRGNTQRTKRINVAPGPMRGGIRL
uniref:Uncharacterized protein n=1 Tax=Gokushovirinae environmental samples TaxID=1478972 RepID=A0A2R3UAD5_9VIRU|nr:hypothetical protein [Gokushovirinae environmental samples]